MTVVLAIKGMDGVLLLADKRETEMSRAQRKSDSAQKVYEVGSNCAIAVSGDGACGTTILERFVSGEPWCDLDRRADCREVADALCALLRETEEAAGCFFLVAGHRKRAARKMQCIKRLEKDAHNYFPRDCPSSGAIGLGRDWFLYYCQELLGVDFPRLSLSDILPIALFVLSESGSVSLDVGPSCDIYELREDGRTLITDTLAAQGQASKLRSEIRNLLRRSLLPPHLLAASKHHPD